MARARPFHKYRGVSSFSIKELAAIAGDLLTTIAPRQPRYRVSARPTERTIRFYTTTGHVDKPLGKEGTTSKYGYRQLLQILAIKTLQAQYACPRCRRPTLRPGLWRRRAPPLAIALLVQSRAAQRG